MTSTHPTPVSLSEFAGGRLATDDWRAVEDHVSHCPHCLGVLRTLPESDMSRRARDAVRRTSVSDDTPFPAPPPGMRT